MVDKDITGQRRFERVVSEIRALYRDENDLLRTLTERIYEQWYPERKQWYLKKVESIFVDPEFPVLSDNPAATVKAHHDWVIPSAWDFISEVWEYTRKSESEITYEHEVEIRIIR